MRTDLIQKLQRLFLLISVLTFAGIVYLAAQTAGYPVPQAGDLRALIPPTPAPDTVALISGHAGFDSGAVCGDDTAPTLQEVDVVAGIAQRVEARLAATGLNVLLLEEYDPRLANLDAKLLLSLHADSCVPISGYKAARRMNSAIPSTEDRLIACIDSAYAEATGLVFHSHSITHDMTRYHAFRKALPTTPAAILEMGFLGGDGPLLTRQPDRVAAGIAESVLCFLQGQNIDAATNGQE